MHDLKFVWVIPVAWKFPHQGVSELTPIAGGTTDTNSDNIEMVTVVVPATGIAFGGTRLL